MNKQDNIPNFGDELKKNPFSTPTGYFDELPFRIQEKCVKPKSQRGWLRMLLPQLGFAASFIVLVFVAKSFFNITTSQTPENTQEYAIQQIDTVMYYDENGEVLFEEEMALDDAIISYLVDNKINDHDIVQ